MDFIDYASVKTEMEKNPTLCNLFQLLATETWKRMEFSYKYLNKDTHEPTLTQNLVFNINAFAQKYGFNIIFEEATNEATNGNDLELILYYEDSEYVFYAPIQAKRVKSDGEYKSFPYKDQILKLISYANRNNGFPLYLFYNYSDLTPAQKTNLLSVKDCLTSIDETQYGCTIASAKHLKDSYVDCATDAKGVTKCVNRGGSVLTFLKIHPNEAFPWRVLVCCAEEQNPETLSVKLMQKHPSSDSRNVIIEKSFGSKKRLPGVIKKDEISKEGWRKIVGENSLHDIPKNKLKAWRSSPETFSPRYRMSITIQTFSIDTILVHAKPKSYAAFEKSPKKWSEINIGEARLKQIKYIAFYVSSPEMKIVSIATIDKIVQSKTSDKFNIFVKDLTKLKTEVKYDGSQPKSRGRVYISKRKLESAKTWSQLFEKNKK